MRGPHRLPRRPRGACDFFEKRSSTVYSAGTRNSVKTVDTVSPPMTARASGRLVSLPSPMPSAIGIRPTMVAMVVIRIGRSRVRPASMVASMQRLAARAQHVREVDQQHAVRHHDADHHDDAHEAVHARASCR